METLLAPESVQTRCPNCQTVFEIDQKIVHAPDPRVRCGECFSVFNSYENLLMSSLSDDLLVDAASHDLKHDSDAQNKGFVVDEEKVFFEPDDEDVGNSEQFFSDADLFSEQAGLPEMEYLEEGEELPEIDFETIDPDGDKFDGTLFDDIDLNEETIAEQATDAVWQGNADDTVDVDDTELPVSVEALDESTTVYLEDQGVVDSEVSDVNKEFDEEAPIEELLAQPKTSKSASFLKSRALMVMALIFGLGSLYAYANWHNLRSSSMVTSLRCFVSNCEPQVPVDLSQLQVVRRDVFTHPKVEDALVINIVFRNNAQFDQPYPVLGIQMSDIRGEVVAQRDFYPHEYLKQKFDVEIPVLDSGQTADISLEVQDPGEDAKSFELDFK